MHSVRLKLTTPIIILCCAALTTISSAASADAVWLWSRNPTLTKQQDLTANTPIYTLGYDCEPVSFRIGNKPTNMLLKSCQYSLPFGTVSRSGALLSGSDGPYMYRINGVDVQAHPYVVGDALYVLRSTSNGLQVYTYDTSASPTIVKAAYFDGISTSYRYEITYPAAKAVKKSDGNAVYIGNLRLYFSANQKWVGYIGDTGALTIANTATWQTKTIYKPSGVSLYESDQDGGTMAVSGDGKYIATNPITKPSDRSYAVLWLFDTTTCHDQSTSISSKKPLNTCEYNDIWQGLFRGQAYGSGLKSLFSSGAFPRNMQLAADGSIWFDARVNVAGANFGVERYQAKSDISEARQYVSVLGMGDSYISGEGAHAYRFGTDTADNKCHTSVLSYPIVSSNKYLPGAQTVACSGARIFDIDAGLWGDASLRGSYLGQVQTKRPWDERREEQSQILNNFSPGYGNQILFAEKYQPRTILLSIGGNNIHFADIVSQCVSPTSIDTCYYYREDRIELMQTIIDHYGDLVRLYRDIVETSPGTTVYVTGYPQVAKPGGSCGANVLLNETEVLFSSRLITYLNVTIKRAASDTGVVYVDNESALSGYRLCEAPRRMAAVNGFTVGRDSGVGALRMIGQESYHPTAYGHSLLAKSIESRTNNLTLPMPTSRTNYGKPSLNLSDPLITGVVASGRQVNNLVWRNKPTMMYQTSKKYLFKHPTDIGANTTNRAYKLVLRSDPITLAEGRVVSDTVEVAIPADVPGGYHTLDYYTTDEMGKPVDVRQVIFVASAADLVSGACLGLPVSGQDSDGDTIDDACDGDIDTPNTDVVTQAASQSDEDLLTPMPPKEIVTTPISEPKPSQPVKGSPLAIDTSPIATTITPQNNVSARIPPVPPVATGVGTSWTDWLDDSPVTTPPVVLGSATPRPQTPHKQSITSEGKADRRYTVWLLGFALPTMLLGLTVVIKKVKRY